MLRFALVSGVVIVALGCPPRRPATEPGPVPPPVTPIPPPPARSATEVVRFGPSALRYVAHQLIHIEQEFQGIRQPLDYGLRIFFRATISGPADSVGYQTTMTIDSVLPDSGTTVPMGVNLAQAKGLSFTGRLAPTGEFRNPVASDSVIAQALSPIVGSFRNFFPRLPASGATHGSTWTDTVTTSDRAAGNVTVTSISRSRAASWEERNGARCLRIEVQSDFTIQGSGEQAGQPFQVAGNGQRSGVDYIAVDGRYLGGEAQDSTTMTITLPVQSMVIPRTQKSRTTVTVLP